MAKITSITVQKKDKKRCNIFLDNEFFMGVSVETIYKHSLKIGMEISEKQLNSMIFDSERTEALEKAISYISKAIKTKKQVKDYLIKKGYDESIVWEVIDRLKEYDYINDAVYAKSFMESTSRSQGRKLMEYKLMNKGVKKEDINLASDLCEIPHKENARILAEKYMRHKEKTKENFIKLYRYLISRGFSYDEVDFACSPFKEED